MRIWLISVFFLLGLLPAFSQDEAARKIKGLSTEIIYDLYSDSKGFLWIAHSQGLSRYDGHSFTYFESPDQSPIDVTNICEDQQGRIWIHDFTGQIFYIENEKMNLFEPYIARKEKTFPAMVIVDSELVITSSSGLFVLNTGSFKWQYLTTPSGNASTNSLAVCGNTVIAHNRHETFKYQPGKGLIKIPVVPMNGIIYNKTNEAFMLDPFRTKDTLYAHNNESGEFFTFIERNDSLLIVSSEKTLGIVNTIINCAGTIWINTKKASYTRDNKKTIVNQNITDIVQDKDGNRWYGSLQEGLAMVPADKGWEQKALPFLPKNDFIRCMFTHNDEIIYGTQSGKIIVLRNNRLVAELFLPPKAGSVEHIFILPNKRLLIAPSIGLYFANIEQKKVFKITGVETVKGLAITDSSFLLARATDLSKIALTPPIKKYLNAGTLLPDEEQKQMAIFSNWVNNTRKALESSRCYLVSFDKNSKKTFAVFKNGLATVTGDSVRYILFDNKPIKASCLIQENGNTYVGSLNKGVFVYTDSVVEMISRKEGLVSNTILKMKIFDGQLYLIEPKCLQVWDIQQKKLVTTIPLPNDNEGTVYDFLQKNGVVHLTFTNTLYNLALSDIEEKSPPAAYLLSAKTSGTGENVFDNTVLPYYENTIQFNLSTPSYVYPEASYFMYRLLGVYDTSWKKIDGPVYDISFTSLKPGNYYFEAYAVNFQNIRSANTIRVHFKINRPLWQQVWFSLMVGSIIFIAFLLIFLQRLKNIRLRNQLVIDKLTLQNELRKSLLRTIIAQMNPHFVFNALNTIQSFVYKNDKISVSNYMGKFSELIRKILDTSNIDAITLQEEIEIINLYLDLEKARFEEDFNVQLKVAKALEPELIEIPPMFIQPYIENAIKHGLFHKKGSRHLAISIDPDPVRPGYIRIIVEDDGIGRARSIEINSNLHKKHKSFASSALENRINLINQTLGNKIILHITDKPNNAGTIVTIELPIIKSTI